MNIKKTALLAITCVAGSVAFSVTPLLEDPDFADALTDAVYPPQGYWRAGTNHFMEGFQWRFWDEARDGYYLMSERVVPSGSGFEFLSYDDFLAAQEAPTKDPPDYRFLWPAWNTQNLWSPSDWLYNQLFVEQKADPVDGIFNAGDTIVFKGSAKANRIKDVDGNMDMNAVIVVAGWIGTLDFQERQWTVKKALGPNLEAFELRTTFPTEFEIGVDELQVVKIGFEINNKWDADVNVMDEGTIYFENLEAYIEPAAVPQWNGFDILQDGWVDTGTWMGMVNVTNDPWVWVSDLNKYMYIPSEGAGANGAWVYAIAQ